MTTPTKHYTPRKRRATFVTGPERRQALIEHSRSLNNFDPNIRIGASPKYNSGHKYDSGRR